MYGEQRILSTRKLYFEGTTFEAFELLTGQWAFDPQGGTTWSAEEDHLAGMLRLTGETFNPSMLARSELRDKYFNEDGKAVRVSHVGKILYIFLLPRRHAQEHQQCVRPRHSSSSTSIWSPRTPNSLPSSLRVVCIWILHSDRQLLI